MSKHLSSPTYIEKGIDRLVFFSDAVFAIAITLLALDVRLPEGAEVGSRAGMIHALGAISPQILAFVLSFIIIGIFWASHVRKYRALVAYNSTFVLLNIVLLMLIAFMPFPTSLISASASQAPVMLYASILASVGILSALNWMYAVRHNFIDSTYARTNYVHELRGPIIMAFIFVLSVGLAIFNPRLAMWSWLLLIPATKYLR